VFHQPTGPTAWLAPVYPFPAIIFSCSAVSRRFILLAGLLSLPVLGARLLAAFLCSTANRNRTTAARGGLALAVFQRNPYTLRMDMGLLASRTAGDQSALDTFRLTDDPRAGISFCTACSGASALAESGAWSGLSFSASLDIFGRVPRNSVE